MATVTIAKGKQEVGFDLSMLNRHGLIAGATGTGKTVTLKVIVEQLSKSGIPTFLADIKGDLVNLAKAGEVTEKITERLDNLGITDFTPQSFPVRLWDVFGEQGTPVRTTISEMGPLLLSRILGLNDTQSGILNIAFKVADDKGWLLIDLKDLKALLQEIAEHASDYSATYGHIAKQSVAAIQRSLLVLEQEGGDLFFGEPALEIADFFAVDAQGNGVVNVLNATKLFQSPTLYATYLLWLLSELYETLPEVGDLDQPKFVFFFDEAHLLFKDAPKVFVEKIEQIVRLVRSKGVGVFFITQNPMDLPETVLAQLGNRVQHALRAYTPKELKAVKTAAETFRQNPDLDITTVMTELQVGEALVSFLNEKAQPNMVERAMIYPPLSSFDVLTPLEVQALINQSPLDAKYREIVDRESAFERLAAKVAADQKAKQAEAEAKEQQKQKAAKTTKKGKSTVDRAVDTFLMTAVRTIGREIVRGLLGGLKKR